MYVKWAPGRQAALFFNCVTERRDFPRHAEEDRGSSTYAAGLRVAGVDGCLTVGAHFALESITRDAAERHRRLLFVLNRAPTTRCSLPSIAFSTTSRDPFAGKAIAVQRL
jgi:hypothetical protein